MDLKHYEQQINKRIAELNGDLQRIKTDLDQPLPKDLIDQAIDLEDDEVLEGLGQAHQKEIGLLEIALKHIADGSYGTCQKCGDPISEARLDAVPYAQICKSCAVPKAG